MSLLEDRRLLVKIAQMYYEEGATQSEIATEVGVSRSLISKYLTKAKELGIVEIIIHDEEIHPFKNLERKLEKIYGLREVVITPTFGPDTAKSRLGVATSKYLLRIIKDGQTIGVSSGTTLHEVAKAMPTVQSFPNVTFVPLVGGVGDERVDTHANYLVAKLAEAINAKYKLLHAPVVVDTKEVKDILIKQKSIQTIFNLAAHSDVAIVGIGGTPEHSTMVKSYLGREYNDEFKNTDVVGDICYNFINKHGTASTIDWNDKVISLNIEKLKEIPLVIGVACGFEKVAAIKSSLIGKLIDVLVTDEQTAKVLIS
jgi:deoxyribonucleoside regulator